MISVVIPSYKNLALCQQAVASVLKQASCNYEVIITDDTPGSEIEVWANSLNSNRIRYYHNVPSKGAIDNWNYGLSLAKGDILILLHHDEAFINEDYLEKLSILLKRNDVVISNKKVIVASGVKKERFPNWIKRIILFLKYPLFAINVIGPCACVAFRKEFLQEFDNRMHWKVDIDWYFRILKSAKKVLYIDSQEIISHHGHDGQITNNINIAEVAASDISIIRDKYNSFTVNLFLMIGKLLYKLKKSFK